MRTKWKRTALLVTRLKISNSILSVLFFILLYSTSEAMFDRQIVVDFEDNEKGVWLAEETFMRDLIFRYRVPPYLWISDTLCLYETYDFFLLKKLSAVSTLIRIERKVTTIIIRPEHFYTKKYII